MVWCIQKPIQPTEPDPPRVCILDRKHEELWRNLGHVLYIHSFHLGKSIIHVHWKQAWRRWIVLIDIDMACDWNVRCPFRCWDFVKAAFWLACLVLHALSVDATVQDISGFQKSSEFAVKCMNYRCFHSVSFNCLWWYVIAHFSCQAFCCSIKSLSQDVRHSSTEPFKHWMTLGDDLAHILIP